LLETVSARPNTDTLVVGGDVHAYAVCDLKVNFDDPSSPIVATEFCGTSISSQGPSAKETTEAVKLNKHIQYANGDARGYVRVALSKDKADVTLRSVESVKVPNSPIKDLAQYTVAKGKPGAQKV
jgi:alkaline phosphatase D